MNADTNLQFDVSSPSKQLLNKYCNSFAGTSVSASALATVAALLSLSTATSHPPTPSQQPSLPRSNGSAMSVHSHTSNSGGANNLSLQTLKGSEPSPRTPPTGHHGNDRFHVYLCSGYDDATHSSGGSGSDATSSSARSHATESSHTSSSARRAPPLPITTLPDSWLTMPATVSPSGRTNHSSCVYTFHYCVRACGGGGFTVYEAKIIPVSANILLASAPLYVAQSRLTDITTFQAPTIGVFVRESSSHRRRQLSTTPYTPESIELYAEVLAELLRNSPFMVAVSPRTPSTSMSSKTSTQRGLLDSSSNANTPEQRFGRPNGASSTSSLGSHGGPHRFGDADLRPHHHHNHSNNNNNNSNNVPSSAVGVVNEAATVTLLGADGLPAESVGLAGTSSWGL